MKKILRTILIVLPLVFQTQLFANTVVVKGTVKDSLNKPVVNKKVIIYNSDSSNTCRFTRTVTTNANGYYIDTITCADPIRKLLIAVENCNGTRLTRDPNVGNNGIVEVNFIVCTTTPPPPPPATCKAMFSFTSAAAGIKFSAIGSTVPAGDSITGYTWSFGDSTPVVKGTKDPLHVYAKAGTYNVCLTINTKKGCENKYCTTVVYTTPQLSCKATALFTVEKVSPKKFRFNSTQSSVLAGDSIFQRIWQFSDGSSMDGNKLIVEKEFKDTGVLNVCLKVASKKGCDNKLCITVTVRDSITPPPAPATNCKAVFGYTIKESTIKFNSAASTASSAPGDSIISRTWMYSDSVNSVSLGGNIVDPSYTYAIPGNYKVTLVIKTKKGCESRTTVTVTIPPPPPVVACKASFTYKAQLGSVTFNSNSKGATAPDSITSYTWIFGDSTLPVQGTKDPLHVFTKSGRYNVILYIKTKSGCESKYSESISVTLAPVPPVNCAVDVQFVADRVSVKKIQLNSSLTKANPGDSIAQRNWKFGDGTALGGNEIKPYKEYAAPGIYNVCLEVKTVKGCVAQTCKSITVQDTVTTPQASVDYLKIVSINPNPVITKMMLTVFSRNSNAEAEIVVFDIYGAPKMTIKKLLAQGNNVYEINTANLFHGPYFIKVSTKSGKDSKAFYKL